MTLLVGRELDGPRFRRFFVILSEVANLVDKLDDVRRDRSRGEIAIRAGLWVHLRLFAAFARRGAQLLAMCPKPLRLLGWGTTYLVPPTRALG